MAEAAKLQDVQKPTFVETLVHTDLIQKLGLLKEGWYIDPVTKKMVPHNPGIDPERPWIYVHVDQNRLCGAYQMMFNTWKFVPSFCLNHCWKVAATPRKVSELFKIFDIQEEYFGPVKKPCKCGTDERPWTPHLYGGYWYCHNKKQGLERWQEVRSLVSKHIGDHVPVILKRYCTEFEMQLGPSDQYEQPPFAQMIEDMVMQYVDAQKLKFYKQPEYLRNHVMRRWLEYAYKVGDLSCYEFNDGKPFYEPLVMYHHELEIEYIKKKEAKTNG